MSSRGKQIAWTSPWDHCASTPTHLTTRDAWVYFDDTGDVPAWMDQCTGNAHLARVDTSTIDDGRDERAVISADGRTLLIITDAQLIGSGGFTLYAVDLDPTISRVSSAIVQISPDPSPGSRVLWATLSGDGQVVAWSDAAIDGTTHRMTAGSLFMANLRVPDAARSADSGVPLPDEPIHAEITDCLSARGVVNVAVHLRQWSGGDRHLLLLGSVTNGTDTENFGPLVQELDDGEQTDVNIAVGDLSGALTCTLRVVDPGQTQMDVADVGPWP